MAGIGFELKKMFKKEGVFAKMRAYGYAGVVVVGPMILGVALLLGIRFLSMIYGADEAMLEKLNCLVTVTLVLSLVISSFFTMPVTRYVADQLYEEKKENVLPALWGSISILVILGALIYIPLLFFSGLPLFYAALCFFLLEELMIVWTEMNFLSAIKDYKGVMVTFLGSLVVAFLVGAIMLYLGMEIISAMLITVCVAYGIMGIWYYHLLSVYFPEGKCSSFLFLRWMDKYSELPWVGIFIALGLYGHLAIMWFSPLGVQISGIFHAAPEYDIPALLAFFSILATTINFVTSMEVNFYPKYRNYFSLFNDGGSFTDIEQAEKEMRSVLVQELTSIFTKQFFVTVFFIVIGSFLLPYLPLGMNEDMLGIFRVLCIGYAFYAIGNCAMLIQLYYSDNKGAYISTFAFVLVSNAATLWLMNGSIKQYGVGFLIGGFVFMFVSLLLLYRYMKKIMFKVLCTQPIVASERRGLLTKWAERSEQKYQRKYNELLSRKE